MKYYLLQIIIVNDKYMQIMLCAAFIIIFETFAKIFPEYLLLENAQE